MFTIGSKGTSVPYIPCPTCGLETYSAAAYSRRESCPTCASPLPVRKRVAPVLGWRGRLFPDAPARGSAARASREAGREAAA